MANVKYNRNQRLSSLLNRHFLSKHFLSSTAKALVLSWLMSACSTVESINESMPWYAANEVESVGLMVKFDAQLQHAISVDLVFAYDENLVALLSNATATQWFTQKTGYIASYGHNMDIVHREIVPGYSEHITELPERHSDAKAVVAFAYYPNDPTTIAVLTPFPTPWLLFSAQTMTLLQTAPQASVGGL